MIVRILISGFIDDIEYIRGLKNIIYDDPHTDHTLRVIKNKLENKQDNLINNQERLEQLSIRPDVTAEIVENVNRFYANQNIVLINGCISSFNEISGNIHFPEGFNKKELLKTLYGGEGESEILSSVSERSVLNNINQNEVGESTTQNFVAINSFIGGYFELPEGNDVDMQNSSESSSTIDSVFELYGGDETNLSQRGEQIWGNINDRQPSDFSAISSISNVNSEVHDIDEPHLHQSYSAVLPASINNSYQRDRSTSREIFKFKNIKNAFKRCLCFKQ